MLGVLLHVMLHASDPCIMFHLMLHVVFHVVLPSSCHVRVRCCAACFLLHVSCLFSSFMFHVSFLMSCCFVSCFMPFPFACANLNHEFLMHSRANLNYDFPLCARKLRSSCSRTRVRVIIYVGGGGGGDGGDGGGGGGGGTRKEGRWSWRS